MNPRSIVRPRPAMWLAALGLVLSPEVGVSGEPGADPGGIEAAPSREMILQTLMTFDDETIRQWMVVNDGVMGGVSSGRIFLDGDAAVFEGTVSKENNGGFASVRALLAPTDLSGWDGIALRVEGGGLPFQLRLRTDTGWDGVAYRAVFPAPDGDVRTVYVPFAEFEASWRGRILKDAPPLDTAGIRQIGFLIADGHEGAFRLRVGSVAAYRSNP